VAKNLRISSVQVSMGDFINTEVCLSPFHKCGFGTFS
jgi:hypothetical protein